MDLDDSAIHYLKVKKEYKGLIISERIVLVLICYEAMTFMVLSSLLEQEP